MTNKKTKKYFSLLLFSALLFIFCGFSFFTPVQAAGIVPCGDSSTPCTICYMITGIKNLIDWGTKILVTISVLAIIVSGIIYIISSGSSTLMESAKKALTSSIIGFAIFFCAWIMVNTVMLILSAKTDLGVGATNWYTFNCTKASNALTGATTTTTTNANSDRTKIQQNETDCNKYCTDLGGTETVVAKCVSNCMNTKAEEQGITTNATTTGESTSDKEMRDKLTQAGFTVQSSGNCTDRSNSSCTSFDGMYSNAADELIAVKEACGISTITGANETGHASHQGLTFDVRANSTTAQCIHDNMSSLNISQLCTDSASGQYRVNCSNYTEPSGVLHIKFKS